MAWNSKSDILQRLTEGQHKVLSELVAECKLVGKEPRELARMFMEKCFIGAYSILDIEALAQEIAKRAERQW